MNKNPGTTARLRHRLVSIAGALTLLVGTTALAQSNPPIRLIVPLTPGSLVDTVARAMSDSVAKESGRAVVVENIPGAGNIIGTTQLVRSTPDGLTLAMVSSNHVINPSIYKSIPFDSLQDITPISVVGTSTMVLAVRPDLPADTPEQFISLLKAQPGKYNMGSGGNGTTLHLAGEMLMDQAKIKAEHIPFTGQGPLLAALMGGQVDFGFVAVATSKPLIEAGKLKAIAVSAKNRSASLPHVPTLAESGLPEFELDSWVAVIAPANLASGKAENLQHTFKTALQSKAVRDSFEAQGILPLGSSPQDTTAYLKSEYDKYAELIKKLGIQVN